MFETTNQISTEENRSEVEDADSIVGSLSHVGSLPSAQQIGRSLEAF